MNQVRNYDRQMWKVQHLEVPPSHGDYELTEFHVEEIERTPSVMVKRKYRRKDIKIGYRECFIVGPRGGVKEVYSSVETGSEVE